MKSKDYYQAIETVKDNPHVFFKAIIGDIELTFTKKELLIILDNKYSDARRVEFKEWLESSHVKGYQIAERLGINTIAFSQLLNGSIKSNKVTGSQLQFVQRCEDISQVL